MTLWMALDGVVHQTHTAARPMLHRCWRWMHQRPSFRQSRWMGAVHKQAIVLPVWAANDVIVIDWCQQHAEIIA